MEAIEIIWGFSEIKLELIKKRGLSKAPGNLRLWFSYLDHILYVHDYDNHTDNMVIALWTENNLKIYFESNTYAIRLTQYAIQRAGKENLSAKEFNILFNLFGFFRSIGR